MSVTAAALQAAAESSASSAGTGTVFQVTQGPIALDATYDSFYVVGVTTPYAGRSMWVCTIAAENAATQAADVLTALTAGPVDNNCVAPTAPA